MHCVVVSHTHWDREWYKTFQQFRARLVDAVDLLLDLCATDPGYQFVLDGQTILLEDYVEIRPQRRAELEGQVRAGRIAVGPWYVQPDSLIPSGEAHVRNLLEGRRVAESFGGCSQVAYTPDSFGHPAQFPQLFAGFGLRAFVYWRGNGDEIADLPSEYLWEAPDGTRLPACHLGLGYFAASHLDPDVAIAAAQLERAARKLGERARAPAVLLMNGVDHQMPQDDTAAIAAALAERTGWRVERGLLEDFVALVPDDLPVHRGELLGGRVANLLPGVWSSRTPLKLRNRACEALLEGWAEPFAAIARRLGMPDESPALRGAWRALLQNQAHDSIGGCSRDRVHEQMPARFDSAEELGRETAIRVLERLAGVDARRESPWSSDLDLAVFNPLPHPASGIARFAIDPNPAMKFDAVDMSGAKVHPQLLDTINRPGYVDDDGVPARVVISAEPDRYRLLERSAAVDVEMVVRDVPPLGWKRVRLRRAAAVDDQVDDGREIGTGAVALRACDDGTFAVDLGGRSYGGLLGLEDTGDRGDTYDFAPAPGGSVELREVRHYRARHTCGIEVLHVTRTLRVPRGLDKDEKRRSDELVDLVVTSEARVAPGMRHIELTVGVDNTADDHRLRLLFPSGAAVASFIAASTFDTARRAPGATAARNWVHPPPPTFPHQGWVAANGLGVAAPGLLEGEVSADGTIAITLLRAVARLARIHLDTRPIPAGPAIFTPGAQCRGHVEARLALFPAEYPEEARAAELGLRAVRAGAAPLLDANHSVLSVEPRQVVLSAFKPADRTLGALVVRLLNPTGESLATTVRLALPYSAVESVRLDETNAESPFLREGDEVCLVLPPHSLRTLLFR